MSYTDNSSRLPKIGLWPIVSLVTGNIIGAGVFLLPSSLAAYGTLSLWGWGISSTGALLLALTFGFLSMRLTATGGPHVYVQAALGQSAGYYTAWGYWVLSWVSNTALLIGALSYLSSLFGSWSHSTILLAELGLLFAIGGLNLFGIRLTGTLELIVTSLKVLPLIIVPLVGALFINPQLYHCACVELPPGADALKIVVLTTFWSFIGLETGTVPSDDVHNPARTIPLGTFLGTALATGIYLLGTAVIMGVVPQQTLIHSSAPYADVAAIVFGGSWNVPIAIAAVICCLSSLNGWTLVTARIPLGAAQAGLFPSFFKTRTRYGAPKWGVILSTLCSAPMLIFSMQDSLVGQFNKIIDASVVLLLIIYVVCGLSFLVIWRRERSRALWQALTTCAAVGFAAWALSAAQAELLVAAFVALALGAPLRWWMLYAKNRSAKCSENAQDNSRHLEKA